MTDSSVSDITANGHCYCGAIRFRVHIPAGQKPIFTAYCHCDSCRRAHSAPLYHVACIDETMFEITAGAALLTEFKKPEGSIVRAFCSECGSKVLNRFPNWKPAGVTPLAFFPSLLEEATQHALPEIFRPQAHNRPTETVLDPRLLADFFHKP